jgi:hypothetical protein
MRCRRAASALLISVLLLITVASAHGRCDGVAVVSPSQPESPQCTTAQDVRARTTPAAETTHAAQAEDGPLHVAVAIIPERGHLASVRELVLTLARRGHRVTFMSLGT